MRRTDKEMDAALAWRLLERAPAVHLATAGEAGPLLRVVHGVRFEEGLAFHGSAEGEKGPFMAGPAVASCFRVIAEIPSHFTHPERACPATTFYESAMVHGQLEPVCARPRKARALQALMERYQPGGGYRPITADDPLYTAAIDGVSVWKLVPERVSAKAALGQKKNRRWRLGALRGLWAAGQVPPYAELARAWQLSIFDAPEGARIEVLSAADSEGAAALLEGQYWTTELARPELIAALEGSPAWMGARDAEGCIVATARAIGDGHRLGHIMDVAVREDWRGRGLGRALIAALLDHPSLRACRGVTLHTRDAGGFYAGLGFARFAAPPWRETWLRRREA